MSARNGAPANVNRKLPREPGLSNRGDCRSTPAVLMSSTRTLMFVGQIRELLAYLMAWDPSPFLHPLLY